jgi:hypothetical protein
VKQEQVAQERGELPADATEASRRRYEVVRELAERCPPELASEIALTGSVARGIADDESDIEFIAWADELPPADHRVGFLREAGVTEFLGEPHPTADAASWQVCRYGGFWLEAGWQAVAKTDRLVNDLAGGGVTAGSLLNIADAITHAVALRSGGHIERWTSALAAYPEGLQERLIVEAATHWGYPPTLWTLARRGDRHTLAGRLVYEVDCVLRILFAINRKWEARYKWIRVMENELAVKPEGLAARLDAIFATADAERAIERCLGLCLDTLALIPPEISVSQQISTLQRSLRERRV